MFLICRKAFCVKTNGHNMLVFSIFDPKKVPSIDSPNFKNYGESSVNILHTHFSVCPPRVAKTLDRRLYCSAI